MAAKTTIQWRRDTAANWTSVNPVLAAGEAGFETDTNKFKLGDGTTEWSSLTYKSEAGAGGALGYYGSFYDMTDQPLVSTSAAQAIAIGTTAEANGVGITSGNRVTFSYAGTYSLTFSIQITNTENIVNKAIFWVKKNGVDYPDSSTEIDMPARKGAGNPSRQVITINYVATAAAGDYVQIFWAGDSTQLMVESLPAGTSPVYPAIPSIILTTVQVMYTQLGPTGPTGPTGPSGPSGATGAAGVGATVGYRSGSYYGTAASQSTVIAGANTSYYLPFFVPETTTFDRIAIRTVANFAGTSVVRLGIYNHNNGPDTVLLDAGTVSCTAANTNYEITISQALSAGIYWLCFNSQTAAGTNTYRSVQTPAPYSMPQGAALSGSGVTFTETGITGAFATAGSLGTNNTAPTPFLRKA